jgi:thioredoxin-related protein
MDYLTDTKPSVDEISAYDNAIKELLEREIKIKASRELGKKYYEEYTKTLNIAKNENKNVLMLFYLSGCNGCTVIKHLLSYSKKVISLINQKQYIVLTFDMSEAESVLAKKYNIYAYPAYLLVDNQGKTIKHGQGCLVENGPENFFINWLNK